MDTGDIISLCSCIVSAIATIIAMIALIHTLSTQVKMEKHQRKEATIWNFQILQEQVFDHMTLINKYEVYEVIRNLDIQEFKEIYEDYKVVIARCEHFAVGVEEEVYDFSTVDALAGDYLVELYGKLRPIIKTVRKEEGKELYYTHFEQLANKLDKHHRT